MYVKFYVSVSVTQKYNNRARETRALKYKIGLPENNDSLKKRFYNNLHRLTMA